MTYRFYELIILCRKTRLKQKFNKYLKLSLAFYKAVYILFES